HHSPLPTPRRTTHFLAGAAFGAAFSPAAGAAAAPSAGAPAAASSAFSLGLPFLVTIFCTRTLGSPNGLRPSVQRSVSCSVLMRSPRFSTLRARASWFLRRRLLSIDMTRKLLDGGPAAAPSMVPRKNYPRSPPR